MTRVLSLWMLAALAGCAEGDPFGVPALTPIGEGLAVTRTAIPTAVPLALTEEGNSLYGRRSRELLTDVRAANVGDVLTVLIDLNDEAQFDNESKREREADSAADFAGALAGQGFDGPPGSADAQASLGIGSSSKYRGKGNIDRSENVRLRVAVIVTEVLTNGNLIVSGTQEIRVNAEVRVLKLAGIVNPLDVTRSNTVSYEKIAEARISYGGRGRSSEVQQPNWGQQIYDKVMPF